MKLNKKGFAITGFLYSIFAVFIVVLSMLIMSMISSKLVLNKIKSEVKSELDEEYIGTSIYEETFLYTGTAQTFTAPYTGWYEFKLWGAQGGSFDNLGAFGAYVRGIIYLEEGNILYLYVGGKGNEVSSGTTYYGTGGWNGGGIAGDLGTVYSQGGGGATDIRLINGLWDDSAGLNSRIMVAAGGGGVTNVSTTVAGAGGTLVGILGTASSGTFSTSDYYANGGTQIVGGVNVFDSSRNGLWGMGTQTTSSAWGGGGGGGYYGGAMGYGTGGGGGSSYISGYAGVNSITSSSNITPSYSTLHYSDKYFIDGYMEAGVNEGNGKAKITYISSIDIETTNSNLNSVRYIKDCINGSSSDSDNHWVELQAIKNGVNLAYGITATGTSSITNPSYITDGDITTSYYAYQTSGTQCITIDLGATYNLDEIAVWHYWNDGRTYNNNITYVSTDGSNWIEAINNGSQAETSNGKRVSAYEE